MAVKKKAVKTINLSLSALLIFNFAIFEANRTYDYYYELKRKHQSYKIHKYRKIKQFKNSRSNKADKQTPQTKIAPTTKLKLCGNNTTVLKALKL